MGECGGDEWFEGLGFRVSWGGMCRPGVGFGPAWWGGRLGRLGWPSWATAQGVFFFLFLFVFSFVFFLFSLNFQFILIEFK